MDIIGLLKSLLVAATAYFDLKSKSFIYDITQVSRKRQKELINEIETLRSGGSNDDNDRADVLRAQLSEERRFIIDISTIYTKLSS